MLYWSAVFFILAWGAALLAYGPLPGPLAWTLRVLAVGLTLAFILTATATLRAPLQWLRRSVLRQGHRDPQPHISARNQR